MGSGEISPAEHGAVHLDSAQIEARVVTDSAAMEPYRAAVPATITQYGGRYLTRGGATELIEGGPEPKRDKPQLAQPRTRL